ncbi:hypothetical protein [Blastococcus montanus]|uniref:hypothetical protein n=1 Tax=Blastococcus montanus TaxID=3144973 RepID=UPI0032084668
MTTSRRSIRALATVALSAGLAGTVLAGCGEDDTDPTVPADADVRPPGDLEDPYDGPYTEEFRDDLEGYNGLEVSVTGEVGRIVSPVAFTLVGEGDVEPILVVMDREPGDLRPGQAVAVAAEPWEEFEVTEVEESLGADLPDDAYAEWEGEPYLDASIVAPR